jgi:hypothetical protein
MTDSSFGPLLLQRGSGLRASRTIRRSLRGSSNAAKELGVDERGKAFEEAMRKPKAGSN